MTHVTDVLRVHNYMMLVFRQASSIKLLKTEQQRHVLCFEPAVCGWQELNPCRNAYLNAVRLAQA